MNSEIGDVKLVSFKIIFEPDAKKKLEPEEVFKILSKIRNQVAHETPNSATFSLVLDSLEKGGKIFSIKEEASKGTIPKFR